MAQAIANKLVDKRADNIYCDIKGQLTNENHPDVFDSELLPGERILREFRVHMVKEPRSKCMIYFLAFVTLGMYLLYLYVCSCCRRMHLGNRRSRVAFTNKGRMLMWQSDINGYRDAGCYEKYAYTARTEVRSFHLKDINSSQVSVGRYSLCGPCRCCGEEHVARLRLFVGSKYPTATKLAEYGHMDSNTLFGLNKIDYERVGFLTGRGDDDDDESDESGCLGSIIQCMGLCLQGLQNWATCGLAYTQALVERTLGGTGNMSVDILTLANSRWYDGYHDEFESGWKELADIIKFIMQVRANEAPLSSIEPKQGSFRVAGETSVQDARESKLVEDTVVNVNCTKIPMGDNERVVDALPVLPRMTWYECLCVPFICCRRKFTTKSAMIATTNRLITASEYAPAGTGDYEFYMCTYFVGKLGGGFLIQDPEGVYGYSMDVKTKFGALRVEPMLSRKWPWNSKVDSFIRPRMFGFLSALEHACKSKQTIPAPMQGSIPNGEEVALARQHINLFDDEEICSVVRSENLYNLAGFASNPLCSMMSCGDRVCLTGLVKCFSCGCRPWKLDQFVVLTTHRLLSYQTINNSCALDCCNKDKQLLMWIPLQDVEGMRVISNMTARPANCCDRKFQKCLPCLNTDSAQMAIQMGIKSQFGTIPFTIGKVQGRAKAGLLEANTEVQHFRAAYAFYQGSADVEKGIVQGEPMINSKYAEKPYPEYLNDVEVQNPANYNS